MIDLSIIVPFFNEEQSIRPLYGKIAATLSEFGKSFEIILIDDGSTDQTWSIVSQLAAEDDRIKALSFRRNFGQTAAIMAGIDASSGGIIVPIDGDGQNDPAAIPMLVNTLADGFDVVSGWRKKRRDSFFSRRLPSMAANYIISRIAGVKLNAYGCTLKAYRRNVLSEIRIYGEMHRFIPIFATWEGGTVTEIPVNHLPRQHDKSKYGLDRTFKVVLDLVVIRFLEKYSTNPIH